MTDDERVVNIEQMLKFVLVNQAMLLEALATRVNRDMRGEMLNQSIIITDYIEKSHDR